MGELYGISFTSITLLNIIHIILHFSLNFFSITSYFIRSKIKMLTFINSAPHNMVSLLTSLSSSVTILFACCASLTALQVLSMPAYSCGCCFSHLGHFFPIYCERVPSPCVLAQQGFHETTLI